MTVTLPAFATTIHSPDIVETLPEEVRQSLQRFNFDGQGFSAYIQKIGEPEPLLSHNADIPRNPASVIKLLTTLIALENLTPAYTWKTDFFTKGEISNGTLDGDLIVRGGGDPYLPVERVWLMLKQLRDTGLKKIGGDLIIDQSLFAPINEDPGAFDERPLRAYNVVPAALVSNFNVTRLYFDPIHGRNRVNVTFDPPLNGVLTVKNQLSLTEGACRGYQRGITLTAPSSNALMLDGRFPARCKNYMLGRSIVDKNSYTAELFAQLWSQLGGKWTGSWQLGEVDPEGKSGDVKRILRYYSLPLGDVVRSINKYSNNLMTRMLFLTLGVEADEAPATAEKSMIAIQQWLAEKDLLIPELHVVNGAGSSRTTRISARSLGQILQTGWKSRYMPEFVASMSLSGQDGTFRRRHRSGPLKGAVHAKTGRLDHVIALAGYYQSRSGDRYIVVTLHNADGVHRGGGHVVQDALLRWLSASVD